MIHIPEWPQRHGQSASGHKPLAPAIVASLTKIVFDLYSNGGQWKQIRNKATSRGRRAILVLAAFRAGPGKHRELTSVIGAI